MHGTCYKCGNQELRVESEKVFRLAVPQLGSLLQREVEYACPICGEVRGFNRTLIDSGNYQPPIPLRPDTNIDAVEHKAAFVYHMLPPAFRPMSLSYPAVFNVGDNVLLPTSEGRIDDGTMIDEHGEPDLMADFAEEYLRQFWSVMPSGRLPNSLSEIMPPLLLLVTATELAVKAYWIRSDKLVKFTHSLLDLYNPHFPYQPCKMCRNQQHRYLM